MSSLHSSYSSNYVLILHLQLLQGFVRISLVIKYLNYAFSRSVIYLTSTTLPSLLQLCYASEQRRAQSALSQFTGVAMANHSSTAPSMISLCRHGNSVDILRGD